MKLLGKPVSTDEEIEALRVIRNAGREFMTTDLDEITVEGQKKWWNSWKNKPRYEFQALVYRAEERGPAFTQGVAENLGYVGYTYREVIVGYGLLTRRFGRMYVSLAVHPDHRGKGYGKQIYRDLTERAGEVVYAEIRMDNVASLKAADDAGFETQFLVAVKKAGD